MLDDEGGRVDVVVLGCEVDVDVGDGVLDEVELLGVDDVVDVLELVPGDVLGDVLGDVVDDVVGEVVDDVVEDVEALVVDALVAGAVVAAVAVAATAMEALAATAAPARRAHVRVTLDTPGSWLDNSIGHQH